MRYSLDWLRTFTPVPPLAPRELRDAVTTHIAEVESIEGGAARFEGPVVVGRILELRKHPQADRLQCTVVTTDGANRHAIVCGATNIAVGQTIPVALPGARVLDRKTGESFVIREAMLRGEPSQGMLCSADELGLPPKEDGIHQLPADTPLGTPMAELVSGDTVLEVENKSLTHRPDLWGHRGMARELSVLFGTPLTIPADAALAGEPGIPVRLDAATGTRAYAAVTVEGVAAVPSPDWIVQRLAALGVNPVNALVDVTNLVMLETGQPLHAFDARRATSVRVRLAKRGETMTTFDGTSITLDRGDAVIAGPDGVLALAGVIGAPSSGVEASTTAIVLEAASFDPVRIRRTAARHSLRTDAAVRFEKDLDPALVPAAASHAATLLLQLFPEARIAGVTHIVREKRKPAKTKLSLDAVRAYIGADVPDEAIVRVLEGLGCTVSGRRDIRAVVAPTWRSRDLTETAEFAEEIARFHGYDLLPDISPSMPLTALDPVDGLRMQLRRELPRRAALQLGAHEVVTYPFRDPAELRAWGFAPETHWEVLNPQSGAASHLRTTLLPGLVTAALENLPRLAELQTAGFRLAELGQVFHREPGEHAADLEGTSTLPHQPLRFGLVELGADAFARLRGAVADLLSGLGLPDVVFTAAVDAPTALHPGRTAEIAVAGRILGIVGELHPRHRDRLEGRALAFAELDVAALVDALLAHPRSVSAPAAFPGSVRDVAALLPEARTVAQALDAVRAASVPNLAGIRAIDVFRGSSLPEGSRSVTFRAVLRAADRTLADADIAHAVTKIQDALRTLGAEIR